MLRKVPVLPCYQYCNTAQYCMPISSNFTDSKPRRLLHKTKILAFFCSNPQVFRDNGTLLHNGQNFRYLGMTLGHNGKMTNALHQMARSFAGAIARVWRIRSELGIRNRKHMSECCFRYQTDCNWLPGNQSRCGYKKPWL